MEKTDYILSEKFVPASVFFALSGSSVGTIPSPNLLLPQCPKGYSGNPCEKDVVKEQSAIRTSRGTPMLILNNAEGDNFSNFSWKDIFGGGSGDVPDSPFGKPQVDLNLPDAPSSSGDKVSPDQIMSGIESGVELIKLLGSKRELSEVEGVCGKQPKGFLRSKATKQAWANCASAYMQSKLDASRRGDKKGLSTGAWIGIGIGSAALIGMIIYVVATRKKTVVMAQAPVMAAPVRVVK